MTFGDKAVCCDVQDGGKAAQKLMQPSPQSVDALKKIIEEARHKPGGAAPAHHKKQEPVAASLSLSV